MEMQNGMETPHGSRLLFIRDLAIVSKIQFKQICGTSQQDLAGPADRGTETDRRLLQASAQTCREVMLKGASDAAAMTSIAAPAALKPSSNKPLARTQENSASCIRGKGMP